MRTIAAIIALLMSLYFVGPTIPASPPAPTPTLTATVTSTAAATATATPTAKPEPPRTTYLVTYYGADFQGGPLGCGSDIFGTYDLNDPTTIASGAGGPPCGTRLRLCSETACQNVVVKDMCGGCGPMHLDLSQAAWNILGQPESVQASVQTEPSTPTPVPGGNLSAMPMPPDTTVTDAGCASDGECHWYNFYWSRTHEVVLQGEEPTIRRVHEMCHAHQHWSINGGAATREDLSAWYATGEGTSYAAAATGWPYPYEFTTAHNSLEDFAEACALYHVDPARLLDLSPARYDWMRASLP